MLRAEHVLSRCLIRDALLWGVALWLVGYALGIAFFFVLPTTLIGWSIMPVGLLIMLWVLLTRMDYDSVAQYAVLGVVWTAIAVALDYEFIVQLLSPTDGYYKLDVYLYYLFTLLVPPLVGWWRCSRHWSSPASA